MKKLYSKKEKLLYSIIFTFIWGILAHGFCYFNLNFSHDSLLVIQDDISFQISIGRFIQPLYFLLRGNVYAPALVGFISLTFIGLSVFIISLLFNTDNKLILFIYSGLMTTSGTVALINATYIHDADIYALALFFAVLGVYVCRNFKYGIPIAIIFFVITMGLYQSFFQVSIFLFMILACKDLLNKKDYKQTVIDGLKSIIALIGGLIIYYLVFKSVLYVTNIDISTGYNGLSSVGHYSGIGSIIYCVKKTYMSVFGNFIHPATYNGKFICILTAVIVILSIYFIIRIMLVKKLSKKEIFTLFAIIVLMPFGMNFVCFISKGIEHHLMIYSFIFAYVFATEVFLLWINCKEGQNDCKKQTLSIIKQTAIPIILLVIIFNNIVFSNQIYLKKQLEYDNTLITMNRIVDRIEETSNYVVGETPVMLIGDLESSPLSVKKDGFNNTATGLNLNFSVTYFDSYKRYFKYILNYPVNLLEATDEWIKKDVIKNMPSFPNKNSCKIVDGVMIVKLS